MARIRTIKPEFSHSESMGRVSRDARLLFVLLWPLCDDSGRARGDSRFLARTLYPYDDGRDGSIDTSATDVERWLGELEGEGCLVRYEVDGSTYLEICNWLKHQKIDKPSASKIPAFDGHSRILARPRESSALDLVPGPGSGPGSRKGTREGEGDEEQVAPPEGDASSDELLGDTKRPTLQSRRAAASPAAPATRDPDPVDLVFDHWRRVMVHPQAKLDDKRRKAIKAAFKLDYTVDQLRLAIDGCKASPFHQGQNDRAEVYDELCLILRTAGHIDKFIRLASQASLTGMSPAARQTVSAAQSWLNQATEEETADAAH